MPRRLSPSKQTISPYCLQFISVPMIFKLRPVFYNQEIWEIRDTRKYTREMPFLSLTNSCRPIPFYLPFEHQHFRNKYNSDK